MMVISLFLILQVISYANTVLELFDEQQDELSSVEDLLHVLIEDYIPENESITLFYDGMWKESHLKPGDILRQKSSKYRTWMTKTYRKEEGDDNDVVKVIGTYDVNKRLKTVHENMIIYYNVSQRYLPQSLKSTTVKNRILIYLDKATIGELIVKELCFNLAEIILSKRENFILIMMNSKYDTLKVRNIAYRKVNWSSICDYENSLSTVGRWNISTRNLIKLGDFFQRHFSCDYPEIAYSSHGDTECVINHHDSRSGNFITPSGVCIEMLQLIMRKVFFINGVLFLREGTGDFQYDHVSNVNADIFLNEASPTEYLDIPHFVISTYIGFENVSVVLINYPDLNEEENLIAMININVIVGIIITGVAILVACRITSKILRLDAFDSSLFLVLTWATFLGFSVPNQPAGKFRIIFMAFVVFSFFLVTLFSQFMYTDLTVRPKTNSMTIEELEKRGVLRISENSLHEKHNIKSYNAEFYKNITWPEDLVAYVVTNKNLLTLRPDVKYKVLKEYFILPKFLYLSKIIPIDLFNNLVLRSLQAGLDQKWRWKYQQKLSEAYEKYNDYEDDNDHSDDAYDDDDDDDNDDADDVYRPMFISDLYAALLIIYFMLAFSVVVFIVELMLDKRHMTQNKLFELTRKHLRISQKK